MKPLCVTIQMKAIEQFFHVVLFVMPHKVVVTFESLNETFVCDHSNGSFWAVLSWGTVYFLYISTKCDRSFINLWYYVSILAKEMVHRH